MTSSHRNLPHRIKAALLVFPLLAAAAVAVAAPPQTSETPPAAAPERFDMTVRNDFFMGFKGDAAAMKKGMTACQARLKTTPEHPEALVWHGAGLLFTAGQQFGKGDVQNGITSWMTSLREMDKAVALSPNTVGIRIPRATSVLPASRFAPASQQKELIARALSDFETVLKLQESRLATLSPHSRGELLMGLAEAQTRSGQTEKATATLKRVQAACPNSPYAEEAGKWLSAPTGTRLYHNCVGCHE